MADQRLLPPAPPNMRGWPWETGDQDHSYNIPGFISWPRISVITPSYNQGKYIEATLRSVLLQNYPNLEYYVLDAGSSDNSVEIIKKYEGNIDYWHSQKDDGQADALAYGFEHAAGSILCWLNSDDILLPGALCRVGYNFSINREIDVYYSNRLVINEEGRVVTRHVWPFFLTKYHWVLGQPLAQECCFWRAELYKKVGGIDRTIFFIMDYDLLLRMWRVGKFKKMYYYLGCYREHGNSKNTNYQMVRQQELNHARVKYNLVAPGYYTHRMLNWMDYFQHQYELIRERLVVSNNQEWYVSEQGLIILKTKCIDMEMV